MSCRDFEARLEALLDGSLGGEDHAFCVRHAASCPPCRELVEPMGSSLAPVVGEPPSGFLAAVLARTSGAASRVGWGERWRQWALRPRFATEAAYVGVVVLSLIHTAFPGGGGIRGLVASAESRTAGVLDRARVLIDDVHSEAEIFLDRAASLLEKEKP